MGELNLTEIIQDLKPIEILCLMHYAKKEKMYLCDKLVAILACLDSNRLIIQNEDGSYERTAKTIMPDLRDYEQKFLKDIEEDYEISGVGLVCSLNFSKEFIEKGFFVKKFIFKVKTEKFEEIIKRLTRLRELLRRAIKNNKLAPELEKFIYAFPSIVPDNNPYIKYANYLIEKYTFSYTFIVVG
ncbi:hypothetical protein A2331_06845 [Candidatus Falkowbacteria bacterium RIFOXYB2_FULL_34_18]|uniref:Uncharacterized protein n=1 Tax=Candidatus Falkowbacteria bacterium RIFOXYD2_FULL_34_120 TaxID=1798007 RepID=A0A1F5TRS8_9BACT|nr:MAG: hypothetical protein A2331_06845 [Candidatus Falkowbacteria bacterium RIFOXYB2_FULL_34_18]OGF29962.1 MAG: hypothetical protein A2500_03835 [Candidatus Falkowbacteria bacterium RIFOXYC12_FULL_34_55]OGF37180.1 MAG: hypothetical protein A2466_02680 [Candidatus Falkowbacteria bacterium RIFOXYC2_FULL_34_220]OGF39499.1 MAG: hypothetical protein A2515_04205 [Candidatus Falkowbacteria bacterium RIFOXYD12_FULL_34_57]OGF41518.1 MAG: hypothetical protein A2531_02395 [Candidatus Falkowbacteria bact